MRTPISETRNIDCMEDMAYFAGLDFWDCDLDAKYYADEEERFRKRCLNIETIGDHKVEQLELF